MTNTIASRVIVADDDKAVRESLVRALSLEGYTVSSASDGAKALEMIGVDRPDALILDVMMPVIDGLTVCRVLRAEKNRMPILMLTARTETNDRVQGLDAGADDYLVKPFEVRELEARIRSLLRRHRGAVARETYTVGDLTLDTATLQATRDGQALTLTPIGLKLLTVLMRASPRVVTRQQLEREVWGDLLPDSDTLRSHLYTLRKAVDKPFTRKLLHTIPGAGYRLATDDGR